MHVDKIAEKIGNYNTIADGWDGGHWQYSWHTHEFTVRACTISGYIQTIELIKRGDNITAGKSIRYLLEKEQHPETMTPHHILLRDYVQTTPVLCLNTTTGTWREATEAEFPPETEFLGDAPHPINGIYIRNSGKLFFDTRLTEKVFLETPMGF